MAQLAQANVFRPRGVWGDPVAQPAAVLWWVDDGQQPGSSPRAFGMRRRFEPDGRPSPRRAAPRDRPPWRPADRRAGPG